MNNAEVAKQQDERDQRALGDVNEAELLYRTLFNQSPDGILIIDTEGKFIEFNEVAHRQLGYSREEFRALRISDIDPFQTPAEVQASIKKVMETGSAEFEVRHKTKEGEIRDVNVITQLLTISGRRVFYTIWRDITQHKRADKKLMELNANLQALINAIPDMVVFKDVRGRYIAVNKAVETFTGLTRDELVGRTNGEVFPPDVAATSNRSDEEALRGLKPVKSEEQAANKDGEKLFLDTVKAPIYDERSNLTGLVSVTRDITERKQMEEALRASEKFIRSILESVDEGFIVIDRNYKIVSANKAYLNQAKMPLEKVIGRNCYEISHQIHQACHEAGLDCAVKRTFDTGEPSTAMHIHQGDEKNPSYVEIKSYPLKDEWGNTISAIEIINNITEKKRLEEQLRHSQKMEAVGQLAGGIAHDFNNILTAIIGYGSLMKMKMDEADPMRFNLQQILDTSERAASLTRGLLTFSRKQTISLRPVSLNASIKNVEKLLRRLIGEDIELKFNLSPEDHIILADSGQIEQILMNLATNARDAMPKGGRLTVSTDHIVFDQEFIRIHGEGKVGMYALISVRDTGSGMDEKTRERIFEPFFTTKETGRSTGLGLSIVYGIVKRHNGYIICDSEPGRGTVFKIYLPMIKSEIAEAEAAAPLSISGGAETILIAEDDAAVRALMKEMLVRFGYTVIEAIDGEDAITRFLENREKVRLLVLDVIMPIKNGKEVFEEIRKIRPDIKVIFASGYMADILQKKGIPEENQNFIAKPLMPTELLKKVRETLDRT